MNVKGPTVTSLALLLSPPVLSLRFSLVVRNCATSYCNVSLTELSGAIVIRSIEVKSTSLNSSKPKRNSCHSLLAAKPSLFNDSGTAWDVPFIASKRTSKLGIDPLYTRSENNNSPPTLLASRISMVLPPPKSAVEVENPN